MIFACWLLLSGSVWTTEGLQSMLGPDSDFENVSVLDDGTIVLAPPLAEVAALDENSVWSVVAQGDNVYLGTGSNGRVYAADAAGRTRLVHETRDTEVMALGVDARGSLYFGLTPGGTVFRFRAGSSPVPVFESGADYIFALLPGPAGEVYCATGSAGRLYRLSPSGTVDTVFTAPEPQLTALAWLVPGRDLLVGATPGGVVYRLNFTPGRPDPAVSVVYDSPLAEVRALAVDSRGSICIGMNPDQDAGENGGAWVGCVDTTGVMRWQWSVPESTVFDLEAVGEALLVATGGRGIVYRLDSKGRPGVLQRSEATDVIALHVQDESIWLATARPATLARLGPGLAQSGHIAPAPHDCEGPARIGRLDFRAEIPAGSALGFDVRGGNSEGPDSTWTPWRPAATILPTPSGRFIQWRARLGADFPGSTPKLGRVDLFFAIPNRPPAIERLEIVPVELAAAARGQPKPVREVSWQATDPDGDSLRYDLAFRPEGTVRWQALVDDEADARAEFDTRLVPDGWYRLRLTASDSPSRPASDAATSETISLPFVVDNSAPSVDHLRVARDRVSFVVSDRLSSVAACRVSLDAGTWRPVLPEDGIYDEDTESFSIRIEPALRATGAGSTDQRGVNTVAVWAADALGNTVTVSR